MANDYIEMLKERDKAKPMKKLYWAVGHDPLPACPTCGAIHYTNDPFCSKCGQKLMTDTWEL